MIKRIIVATLSMTALSAVISLPALALNDRFDSERQQTINKLNDRFGSEREQTINRLNDRFDSEREQTLNK